VQKSACITEISTNAEPPSLTLMIWTGAHLHQAYMFHDSLCPETETASKASGLRNGQDSSSWIRNWGEVRSSQGRDIKSTRQSRGHNKATAWYCY